jgi:hypothetical protein
MLLILQLYLSLVRYIYQITRYQTARRNEMDITIEQVEQLTSRTGVSYEDARTALEAAGGDLLEALIALEREGKTTHQSAAYSTNGAVPQPYGGSGGSGNSGNSTGAGADSDPFGSGEGSGGRSGEGGDYNNDYKQNTSGFSDVMGKIWRGFLKLIHHGNINHFEVFHHGQNVISIPSTVLVLLLILGFWFVLPAIIIGLFFGCRYRFRGPDLGRDGINKAMDSAGDTAENLKQSVKDAAEESKQRKENGRPNSDS